MKVLNQNSTVEAFFVALGKAKQRVLMLDYDGTIAPFNINRMAAVPYPEISALLEILINKQKTKIAIISGRKISDLHQLFGLAKRVEVWGSHGLERLTIDGSYEVFAFDKLQLAGLEKAKELIETLNLTEHCEIKPGALAIHWRGLELNQEARIFNSINQPLIKIADEHKLKLFNFNAGVELRCPDRDKAFAVNQILSEIKQDVVAAYLGDDLTDEYAFKAIKNRGLAVLVSCEEKVTFADICIAPPTEVINFLKRWIEVTSGT